MSFIGRLIYNHYYQPRSKKDTIRKFGGKNNYLSMLGAEQEMKSYALNHLVIKSDFNSNGKFKINFLTGDDFIHQTLFCTYSFFKFLTPDQSKDFSVYYYSDGTLSPITIEILAKRFSQIQVVGYDEIMIDVHEHLPKHLFPYLSKKVNELPLFKKLVYTHINNNGVSTFFDSDLLFIKKPKHYLNWLYKEHNTSNDAFCIQDIERSYGYSDEQIRKIWHTSLKHNINSGMYAIHSENMDFEFIESLIKKFEENFGPHYYLEQLITAIILEKTENLYVAPKLEYIVFPTYEQIMNQSGTLHHYVNTSKEFYFKESWKRQLF